MPIQNPLADLQAYAQAQLEKHNIPAISLAIWHKGQLHQAAAGILNQQTGVEATTDAIFQIGSITKVFTTCLIMQLVDQGKIDLDLPVKYYLSDFQIADELATQTITVRQLLNHTSGMAGDFFPDDNYHQGNLIARYMDRCTLLPVIHPVGEMYSYSNSAFVVAGRLIEVVSGKSWYQAMEENIYKPLGMNQAIADPKEMIRYRVAMGHIFDGDNTDRWVLPKQEQAYLPLALAPAGATPAMSAGDLITFARAHLEQGLSHSGERWLSVDSVNTMQKQHIELPRISQISHKFAGLGWALWEHKQNDLRRFGHGGATHGSLAMLQVFPDHDAAYVVLLNGFRASALDTINADLLLAVTGVEDREPDVDGVVSDTKLLKRVEGKYESFDTVIDVSLSGEKLMACINYKIDPLPPMNLELKHVEDNSFAAFTTEGVRRPNIVFLQEDAAGVPQFIFNGSRLNGRL